MHSIVIIGAGFSGSAIATQLLRRHGDLALRVVLVNRDPEVSRGVAYGTNSPSHLLNVPVGRMSLFPGDDDDFLRFARGQDARITGGSFVRRSLYGKYLATRLQDAAAKASRAELQNIAGEVVELRLAEDGRKAVLWLADGKILEADRVVLAGGNYPPADPPVADTGVFTGPHYIRDPWSVHERWAAGVLDSVSLEEPVLLIGTGLTMLDVALELDRRGFSSHMFALSRRGLLPQAHRRQLGPSLEPQVVMEMLRKGQADVRRYLRVLRLCIAELADSGIDWRDVIGALRPFTAELWQGLDIKERRRFLRHLLPYWDTHRHRTAPASAEGLARLIHEGTLVVKAGRLQSLDATPQGRVRVKWRPRGSDNDVRVEVATVINCTGPQSQVRKLQDPLIRSLLKQGLMAPDVLNLGVETDADGALLDPHGHSTGILFYHGPFLKARYWECTAVPELRVAAARLAERLVAGLIEHTAQVA